MDIVYVLGSGSKWKNNELRYSLRSIEKYCSAFDHVYIVGEDPGFVQGATIIPHPDKSAYNRDKNIFEKILRVCHHEWLSDDFLFINDDHFFLQPVDVTTFPYYHKGDLQKAFKVRPAGDNYRTSLKNTWEALSKSGKATRHFDVHMPIIYNKKKFLELQQYDWTRPYGNVVKSLYCNHHQIEGVQTEDVKINTRMPIIELFDHLKDKPVFSVGDIGLTAEMKHLLQEKYPDPSRWEILI